MIDSLEKINEEVAIKLGWLKVVSGWMEPQGRKNSIVKKLPDYCHDIKAAWEIANHLEAEGFDFEMRISQKACIVEFEKRIHKKYPDLEIIRGIGSSDSDKPAEGICKAFLKLDA